MYRIPSLYDGDLMEEEEVLLWLIEQRTTDTIEQVTDKVRRSSIKGTMSRDFYPPICFCSTNPFCMDP